MVRTLRTHPIIGYVPKGYACYVDEAFNAPYTLIRGKLRRTLPNGLVVCPLGSILVGTFAPTRSDPNEIVLSNAMISLLTDEYGRPLNQREEEEISRLVRNFRERLDRRAKVLQGM